MHGLKSKNFKKLKKDSHPHIKKILVSIKLIKFDKIKQINSKFKINKPIFNNLRIEQFQVLLNLFVKEINHIIIIIME